MFVSLHLFCAQVINGARRFFPVFVFVFILVLLFFCDDRLSLKCQPCYKLQPQGVALLCIDVVCDWTDWRILLTFRRKVVPIRAQMFLQKFKPYNCKQVSSDVTMT